MCKSGADMLFVWELSMRNWRVVQQGQQEVAQTTGGCIVDLLFGAIKVILHGCLCWSKPIQNDEEVIYWTHYIFTLFARTCVCTVFAILATFWIFTIKDTTKSSDFVLLSFPLFIFSAHGIMFNIARCSYLPIIDATILFPWTAQSNIPYNFSLFAHD